MAEPNRMMTGLSRGVRQRCPNCGEGPLFRRYLKVEPVCPVCANPNGLYRADDAPPYFTILIVGHLVVAPLLAFPFILTWPLAWVLGVTLPGLLVLTMGLLPLVKGAVIGFHWATAKAAPPQDAAKGETA